jgi:hypothetical protein
MENEALTGEQITKLAMAKHLASLPTHDENVSETFKRIIPPTPENAEKVEAIKREFTKLEKLVKELTPAGERQHVGMILAELSQMLFVKAVFDEVK